MAIFDPSERYPGDKGHQLLDGLPSSDRTGLAWVAAGTANYLNTIVKKQPNVSAGLLLFRRRSGLLEVLLAHPGGPFWASKDIGAWTIPKGLVGPGEDTLAAAQREFAEETGFQPEGPFIPLGSIRQKAGKEVHAWACAGNLDAFKATSNMMSVEWPPRSGKRIRFPEVDRCAWFNPSDARIKLNPAQCAFIDRLEEALA